eukprot:TRINITY_DN7162_c0_g1_i1.p1 TRINITY_DN7162_c0_g1~~TRINITY_DN7162_c0_g1_i1.p1  ORF type:complete len:524 (+),score=61.95 TRINITY_DN7162_c0_g1_i1:36-1574(+)
MGAGLPSTSCSAPETTSPLQTPHTSFHDVNVVKLNFAASEGNVPKLQKLIEQRCSVNSGDYDLRTPLHIACADGHFDAVQVLILAKANVNALDRWGHTPLDEAIRAQSYDIKAHLCANGAEQGANSQLLLVDTTPYADYEPAPTTPQGTSNSVPAISKETEDNTSKEALPKQTADEKRILLEALRDSSRSEHWAISASEVQMGTVLSSTLKSIVTRAMWRGTEVVVKSSKSLNLTGRGKDDVRTDAAESTVLIAREEIIHEIYLLSTLRHPDLVMFLGACLEVEPPFFITEFMKGGDLDSYYQRQAQKQGRPYHAPKATFVKWASSVARALSFLHNCSSPIIHRDLKPMNLLLNGSMDLKVTDFGISKLMQPKRSYSRSEDANTEAAPFMSGGIGTWRYMAPEVVRHEQYTDRVDIFSFSLIMWFMCTGSQPFIAEFGRDAELVLKEYLKGKEPRPKVDGSRFSQSLGRLITDCWHVSAAQRPSAYECTQRLAKEDVEDKAWVRSAVTGLFR